MATREETIEQLLQTKREYLASVKAGETGRAVMKFQAAITDCRQAGMSYTEVENLLGV